MKITSRKIEKLQRGGSFLNSQAGQQVMSNVTSSLTNMLSNIRKTKQENQNINNNLNQQKAQLDNMKSQLKAQNSELIGNADNIVNRPTVEGENVSSLVNKNYMWSNSGLGSSLSQIERQKRELQNQAFQQKLENKTNTALSTLNQIGQTAYQFGKGVRQYNNQRLESYRNQQQNNNSKV